MADVKLVRMMGRARIMAGNSRAGTSCFNISANAPGKTPKQKWGPAFLLVPTAPSRGSAGVRFPLNRSSLFCDPCAPAQASASLLMSSRKGANFPSRHVSNPKIGALSFRSVARTSEDVCSHQVFRGPSWAGFLRAACLPGGRPRFASGRSSSSGASDRLVFGYPHSSFPKDVGAGWMATQSPAGGDRNLRSLPSLEKAGRFVPITFSIWVVGGRFSTPGKAIQPVDNGDIVHNYHFIAGTTPFQPRP